MFTVGGRKVYPAEIEADDDPGQVPHALVQAGASSGGPRNAASARTPAPASR
jgi:hypothetical protein